jgi:hypothetical protein
MDFVCGGMWQFLGVVQKGPFSLYLLHLFEQKFLLKRLEVFFLKIWRENSTKEMDGWGHAGI